MKEDKRVKVINSDVYCAKCGKFIGMTCDPLRNKYCEMCFEPSGKLTSNPI